MLNDGGAYNGSGNAQFNMAEIWPFPIGTGGAASYVLGPAGDVSVMSRDHRLAMSDPMVIDRRVNQSGGGARKRKEEDESAKGGASTSGNGLVLFRIRSICKKICG